jgi:hypothetical protein
VVCVKTHKKHKKHENNNNNNNNNNNERVVVPPFVPHPSPSCSSKGDNSTELSRAMEILVNFGKKYTEWDPDLGGRGEEPEERESEKLRKESERVRKEREKVRKEREKGKKEEEEEEKKGP